MWCIEDNKIIDHSWSQPYLIFKMFLKQYLFWITHIKCNTDCGIEEVGAAALCEVLKINTTLKKLTLKRLWKLSSELLFCLSFCLIWMMKTENRVQDKGACSFGDVIKINKTLKNLHLGCEFDPLFSFAFRLFFIVFGTR